MLFKNCLRVLAAGLFIFGLTACNEIDVPNGQIPLEYREMAAAYMGTYTGRIDGRTAQMSFSMNESGKVIAQYSDSRGQDMIDPQCGSLIGDLKEIRGSERGGRKTLEWASFAFHPSRCVEVMGERLDVSFSPQSNGQIKIKTQLLLELERDEFCYWNPIPGGGARRECRVNYNYRYLNGTFKK